MLKNWICIVSLALGGMLFADVKLPCMFSDHAVLSRSKATPVFGWADQGESVEVKLGKVSGKAVAGIDGRWRVNLDLTKLEVGPHTLTVKGKNQLSVKDVVLGEVWLCSGQSNMGFRVENEQTAEEICRQAPNEKIRLFKIPLHGAVEPQKELKNGANWVVVDEKNVRNFSAVGYLFGREIQKSIGGYVGLINNSWGGSALEAWLPLADLEKSGNADLAKWSKNSLEAWKNYDADFKIYFEKYDAWRKQVGRDKPAAEFPPENAVWTKAIYQCGAKLPGNGSIFLRRKFNLSDKTAKKQMHFNFGQPGAILTAFLDGKQVFQSTELQAVGMTSCIKVYKAGELAPGEHELILRFDVPFGEYRLRRPGTLPDVENFVTGWQTCRVDYPKLTQEQLSAFPKRMNSRQDINKTSTLLYNALIYPLKPYALSGVIWYQGCSNAGRPDQYSDGIQAMIRRWREDFESEFPFYYCQLANFQAKQSDPNVVGWGAIRVGQEGALKLPKTGQAILIDCGESGDIHPRDKVTPATRLAAAVLHDVYGKNIPAFSPTCKSVKIEDGQIRVTFDNVYNGLVAKELPATYNVVTLRKKTAPLVRNSPNSQVEGFAVAGEDGKFVWADATIVDKDTVIVKSAQVAKPVKVRYAYQSNPTCNLYNSEGFPAAPFNR